MLVATQNLTTLQRIEEIEIQQILNLTNGTVEQAKELHKHKLSLINKYENEQLIKLAESICNAKTWIQKLIKI